MRYRLLFPVVAVLVGAFGVATPAHAGLDDELSTMAGNGETMTVQQWDTVLSGVDALDRNRLTREWFHHGRAIYRVSGAGSEQFTGRLELGYQVSYPWTLGGDLVFSYTTPNVRLDKSNRFNRQIITPSLFPGVSFTSDLTNGPGIREILTFTVDVTGAEGNIAVSGAHGTMTGADGGVLLRPFARLISTAGDVVTTYGEPWNMN